MWNAEFTAGSLALLRVPLATFSSLASPVTASQYQGLPKVEGYTLQNRFVGDYLLYGSGNSWGYANATDGVPLYALRYSTHGAPFSLPLKHSVDRIEALGKDSVVVGSDGKNLYFTPIELGLFPQVRSSYVQADAGQGETRSHGFFYKQESADNGMIGLPIMHTGQPGHRQLYGPSASVLFLQNRSMSLSELGSLSSQPGVGTNDGCRASCVDWYGNSRPLFLKNRIFALMGYELVEGRVYGSQMIETRRISYAPGTERFMR